MPKPVSDWVSTTFPSGSLRVTVPVVAGETGSPTLDTRTSTFSDAPPYTYHRAGGATILTVTLQLSMPVLLVEVLAPVWEDARACPNSIVVPLAVKFGFSPQSCPPQSLCRIDPALDLQR